MIYDSIIIGGGPAGLSAALILGRCLRNVLIVDSGSQRNLYSNSLHAFLTRDGIPPAEFLKIAHDDLNKYETLRFIQDEVVSAKNLPDYFSITVKTGELYQSKTVLIATGVLDNVPSIEGIMQFYGKTVFNCPYCDAWEFRDRAIGVYGKTTRGFELSLSLSNWTNDLVLFTDGTELEADQLQKMNDLKIEVRTEKIKCLTGEGEKLQHIVLEKGDLVKRDCIFFNTESHIRSKLLEQLGCTFSNAEGVETDKYERTDVKGLFVAGNILREVQLVIVAAGQGAEAAFGINKYLNRL